MVCLSIDKHILSLSWWYKTSIILLWQTPDNFTRQGENFRSQKVDPKLHMSYWRQRSRGEVWYAY